MKYEEMERALFARRARLARDVGPPSIAQVMAAIDHDQKIVQPKRAMLRASRVVTAAVAMAACVAGLFGAARALSPSHERIVSDRSDASAPIDRGVATDPEGPAACMLDRTLDESRNDTCSAAAASPASPAPYASYAALEPSTCSIAGP